MTSNPIDPANAEDFHAELVKLYWMTAETLDSLPADHPARPAFVALDEQLAPCRLLAHEAIQALVRARACKVCGSDGGHGPGCPGQAVDAALDRRRQLASG